MKSIGETVNICPDFDIKISAWDVDTRDRESFYIVFDVIGENTTSDPDRPAFGDIDIYMDRHGNAILDCVEIYSIDMDTYEDGLPIPEPWGQTSIQACIAEKISEMLETDWADDLKKFINENLIIFVTDITY